MLKDNVSVIVKKNANNKHRQIQTFEQSCLVVCLFRLHNIKITKKLEHKIFIEGITAKRGVYYTLAMTEAFSKKIKKIPRIIVEMKKYAQYLKTVRESKIDIDSKKILDHLNEFETPFILYLDNYGIGNIVHEPHFIVVEKVILKEKVKVFDPADGKEKIFTIKKINRAVGMLRKHLLFSPIIIAKTNTELCSKVVTKKLK